MNSTRSVTSGIESAVVGSTTPASLTTPYPIMQDLQLLLAQSERAQYEGRAMNAAGYQRELQKVLDSHFPTRSVREDEQFYCDVTHSPENHAGLQQWCKELQEVLPYVLAHHGIAQRE